MDNPTTVPEKLDVYARVTDQIIAAIEKGVGTWKMPWHTTGRDAFSPVNVASRKPYRGVNTLSLWAAAQAKGYDRGDWGTYRQFQDSGDQVRKGEKATTVVFWKFANETFEVQDGGEETGATKSRLVFCRGYNVFNVAQVDGYDTKPEPVVPVPDRIDAAEAFFKSVQATVRHGGNRAFYSPVSDHIQMPPFDRFDDINSYYGTLAHEHCHWTATPNRCDRQLGKRFGDDAYAAEELIGELGAAFLCAHLGLVTEPRKDHAEYIQSWLSVLKSDKRAIFTAASKAQQAADYLVERAGRVQSAAVSEAVGALAACA